MTNLTKIILFIVFFMASGRQVSSAEEVNPKQRAEGYFGVVEVLEQQKSLDKLLILKKPTANIQKYMKEMSDYSQKVLDELKKWNEGSQKLIAKESQAPPFEKNVRGSIQSSQKKQLILSGAENFELRLLLSQVQASDYLSHAFEFLMDEEPSDSRKAQLEKHKKTFEKFNDRAITILAQRFRKNSPTK